MSLAPGTSRSKDERRAGGEVGRGGKVEMGGGRVMDTNMRKMARFDACASPHEWGGDGIGAARGRLHGNCATAGITSAVTHPP